MPILTLFFHIPIDARYILKLNKEKCTLVPILVSIPFAYS